MASKSVRRGAQNHLKCYHSRGFKAQAPFQRMVFSVLLALLFAGCGKIIHVEDISLSQSSLELAVGQEARLHATVVPGDATQQGIQWKSEDENVATVNADGLVRAVSKGKTLIDVILAEGEKAAVCTVRVSIPVENIVLEGCPETLVLGRMVQLEAGVEPHMDNLALAWTSSHPAVAEVYSNGVVTAQAVGATVVRATTVDGEHTTQCEVSVRIPVSSVSISGCLTTPLFTGQERRLSHAVHPNNATNKGVTWSTDNKRVATVDSNGLVTAHTAGTTAIDVSAADGSNQTDGCWLQVR